MIQTITLREVLAEVNRPNAVFDLKYRKVDGSIGNKERVISRNTDLNERKKRNRDGILKIVRPASGEMRDVYIDLLVSFNGMVIKYPPYL
jgi:hypothetical protein